MILPPKENALGRETKGAHRNRRHDFTGFDRANLPDPLSYYTGTAGLTFREPRGKWRTCACAFHGGSDSMRVNVESGAFVCMAGCGARGGDVLAYEMARTGADFVTAAKALGCWTEGATAPARPAPLPARDALQLLTAETNLIAVCASNLAAGVALTSVDLERLHAAAARVLTIGGLFR